MQLATFTQCYLFPILMCFFRVETHKAIQLQKIEWCPDSCLEIWQTFLFGMFFGDASSNPCTPCIHTVVLAHAHGKETSIRWSVLGTTNHILVKESNYYRLCLLRDLAMWLCWCELSPPKPNGLWSTRWPDYFELDQSPFGFGGESSLQHCVCVCVNTIDWCCFYYFARNSLVALLEALFETVILQIL